MARRPPDPEKLLSDEDLIAGSSLARHPQELEDLLQAVSDRADLERLYQRNIPLTKILQLLGRRVDVGQIDYLLRCDDPRAEIRRLLRSA